MCELTFGMLAAQSCRKMALNQLKWRAIFHVSNHKTHSSVRISVYVHVYIKSNKKWNNKYNIYVIFPDARKESTEPHTMYG